MATSKKQPKTSSERVAKLRAEAKAKGWVRREYYATPSEHSQLADSLRAIRVKTLGE